ncbi:GyrI-like domain-containing protein [Paenibacillus daejeonensis]|uniref:GyrI-like domain-containing protein n=1 Tax=Paenibacillus daejeonensis TaxID=135193 RepID=UPI00035DF8CE|nr:effector binding domain-containing protein [Paenibacillus daejeonensis]
MSSSKNNGVTVATKPAFQAIGLHWEGTFTQAGKGEIRNLQAALKERLDEIPHRTHPEQLLGLSYPEEDNGLTHYALVEVAQVESIPEGMVTIALPELNYVRYRHVSGQDIGESYQLVEDYMKTQGMRQPDDEVTHLEIYPMEQNSHTDQPEFVIMMPVSVL